MKLHSVLEHVELMPARFWNENVVRILAQRFVGIEAEEGLKLAIDVQNFGAARDHDSFRSSIQELLQEVGRRTVLRPVPRSLCGDLLRSALGAQGDDQQLRF